MPTDVYTPCLNSSEGRYEKRRSKRPRQRFARRGHPHAVPVPRRQLPCNDSMAINALRLRMKVCHRHLPFAAAIDLFTKYTIHRLQHLLCCRYLLHPSPCNMDFSNSRSGESSDLNDQDGPRHLFASNDASTCVRQTGENIDDDIHGAGRLEDYLVVAHSPRHQALFEKYKISWGVQYQIATLVSTKNIRWEEVTEDHIRELQGNNAEAAPKVYPLLAKSETQANPQVANFTRNPWMELDAEDEAFSSGIDVCLGLLPRTSAKAEDALGPWWGGRVEQRAVLLENRLPLHWRSFQYSVHLCQAEAHEASFHLARALGSRRFLVIKLPPLKDRDQAGIYKTLRKGLLICGRVFRAFSWQDDSVRFIETNEDVDRVSGAEMGDERRMSFPDFVDWFNPLAPNMHQLVCKWSSRFALGKSTSIPGCIFKLDDIKFIPDIVSFAHLDPDNKPESKYIMSDGCGRINLAGLRVIQQRLGLSVPPTAVQARIAGAKGLWILDAEDFSERPRIWITESQVKIRYRREDLQDPAKRILDVVQISEVKSSVYLGKQSVINFHHNGVPASVFQELLQEGLKDFFDKLVAEWDGSTALRLYETMFYQKGVGRMRQKRHSKPALKPFGWWGDEESDEEEEDLKSDTGPDPYSGWPTAFAEQAIELLEAGFHPKTFSLLEKKIKAEWCAQVNAMADIMRIPVKGSAKAFAAPDFDGILKEGEIFFKSSGTGGEVARGPFVIWRYPCRTPSDARRMTAMDYPALYAKTDVLLFSTKGDRSGMSILAGGDYDGDVVCITNEPRITDYFVNADLEYADAPDGFNSDTEQTSIPVATLLERMAGFDAFRQAKELQEAIIAPISRENLKGKYSQIADLRLYTMGYTHPRTIHATYAFFNELDAAKSGRYVRRSIYDRDAVERGRLLLPPSLSKPKRRSKSSESRPAEHHELATRPDHLEPFVLDQLLHWALEEQAQYAKAINGLPVEKENGSDLLKPLEEARGRAEIWTEMTEELERLQDFVKKAHQSWNALMRNERWKGKPARERRRDIRGISEKFFHCHPLNLARLKYFSEEDARKILVSFAYEETLNEEESSEFAFVVGHKYLTLEKALAGQWAAIRKDFRDCLSPNRAAIADIHSRLQ